MAEEKRCWLYTRIDAPEDAHGCLKAQEKELLDFAAQEGYEVAGTASDLGNGWGLYRPGIARVIEAAKDELFHVLLIKNTDIICESNGDALGLLMYLYEIGVETYTVQGLFIDVHKSFRELLQKISRIPEKFTQDAPAK